MTPAGVGFCNLIGKNPMLRWDPVFFIAALMGGVPGFGGSAGGSAGIPKLLFSVFLVLPVVSKGLQFVRQP